MRPRCYLVHHFLLLVLLLGVISCQSTDDSMSNGKEAVSQEMEEEQVSAKASDASEEVKRLALEKEHAKPVVAQAKPKAKVEEPVDLYPPTMSDSSWHQEAWLQDDCLRCHETGVGAAPKVRHKDLSPNLVKAKCRTCHVLIPDSKPIQKVASRWIDSAREGYWAHAFPPLLSKSPQHENAWLRDDCMMCHENGVAKAPIVRHKGMSPILLKSKCRTCHVSPRSIDPRPLSKMGMK